MRHIKFESDWETIYQYIDRAIRAAYSQEIALDCEFNGSKFVVTHKSTPESAYADFCEGLKKFDEEYKKSDEYKEWQKNQEMKKDKLNKEVVILLEKFDTLDLRPTTFEGMKALLDWLAEYQPYSDNTLCDMSNEGHIISKLKGSGYEKDKWVNAPKETFDNMTYYFEYIVGQAISTMEFLALHGCVVSFRNEWVKQFQNVNEG